MVKLIKGTIYPGEIVTAVQQDPFTRKENVHPYLIWRVDQGNKNLKGVCYAFRLTSKLRSEENWWDIKIEPSEINGLTKTSYIKTDAIHLINAKTLTYVGWVEPDTWLEVIRVREQHNVVEINGAIKTYGKLKVKEAIRENGVQDTTKNTKTD